MLPYEEKILKDIYADEQLDIFGIFKERRIKEQKRKELKSIRIFEERKRRKNILFYKIICKKLIDIYGKEGAIPYLKVLFKENKGEN